MDSTFGFLLGVGLMVFLIYVGNGIDNYLSNKNRKEKNEDY